VGLGNILFGRKKLQGAKLDQLFALSSAQVSLEAELGLRSAGVAAVVFKPLSAGEFEQVQADVDELLRAAARTSGSEVRRHGDSYGFQWLIVEDKDFEDLVTAVHLVSSELEAGGFGSQLLAAVFRFVGRDRDVHLVYGYKRGTFWPFIPIGDEKKRDNAEELRLKNELEGELPIEPELERWFGLFDAPLD
jgi:hypothetical protein